MAEADAAGFESHVTYDTAQVRAPEEIAKRLKIETGSPVSRTHYRFFMDSEPVQLSTQWETLALTGGTRYARP